MYAQKTDMMTLHVFNPEHDLALASDLANFTAPHAARELKAGLGYLPALWAGEGDYVLVEDRGYAGKALEKLLVRLGLPHGSSGKRVVFVGRHERLTIQPDRIDVWGWDAALRLSLLRMGVSRGLMPTLEQLDGIRRLSHRASALPLLGELARIEGTVGEATVARTLGELRACMRQGRRLVVKAPWSGSGRGVRFMGETLDGNLEGWVRNTLSRQGCVMVEPKYNKVKDFGMEFVSDGQGNVQYLGLSLFHTVNGAYAGNILATERAKQDMISRYVSMYKLFAIKETVCRRLGAEYAGRYKGPFGIDMMVVASGVGDGFLVHPCVEINLRRTMGHVAICLSPTDDDIKRVMRINTDSNYLMNIQPLL